MIAVDIDAGLHAGIDALAARTGTSMFMVLQAALASVLTKAGAGYRSSHRFTGCGQVGSPVSNR